MMERDPARVNVLNDSLDIAIKNHADRVYLKNPANRSYAQALRLRALEVRELMETKSGKVTSIAQSTLKDIQPIARIVFDGELTVGSIDADGEYKHTVFDGIYGRARIVSKEDTANPEVALDLTAEDSAPLSS